MRSSRMSQQHHSCSSSCRRQAGPFTAGGGRSRVASSGGSSRAESARQQPCRSRSSSQNCSSSLLQRVSAGALAASQAAAALLLAGQLSLAAPAPAWAVLNSPNARIPRSAEAALRRSIPAFNTDVQSLQKSLEDIAFLLRIPQRKPWGNMAADVASCLALLDNRAALLAGVPAGKTDDAQALLDSLLGKLKQLELAVKTQQPDFVGARLAGALGDVADLELLQAPGLAFAIPKEFASRPRLVGRATVELAVEKADGSLAFVDAVNGGLTSRGKVLITLDGYSAPISAGNFAANVQAGLYDGARVSASYASVITAGPPSRPVPPVPLENLPAGEFDPLYKLPLDVGGGELPVLPLSIAGAVSMTHLPDGEAFLSGDEWFIFKFDKQQAGLSGLAFDEGTFGVFGYVTSGLGDVVAKLESGDVIVSARITSGLDRLVRPAAAE